MEKIKVTAKGENIFQVLLFDIIEIKWESHGINEQKDLATQISRSFKSYDEMMNQARHILLSLETRNTAKEVVMTHLKIALHYKAYSKS